MGNENPVMHRKLPEDEMQPADPTIETTEKVPNFRCAKCGDYFVVTDRKLIPFCSVRCQQVDLAGWLDEGYGLPFEGDTTNEKVEYRDGDETQE